MAKKQKLTPDELQERGIPLGESAGPAVDEAPPPKHGTPVPIDLGGPVPREVPGLARVPAGSGLTRFKVRCDSHTPRKTRYVVARTADEAGEFFLKLHGVEAQNADAAARGEAVLPPKLAVHALPD